MNIFRGWTKGALFVEHNERVFTYITENFIYNRGGSTYTPRSPTDRGFYLADLNPDEYYLAGGRFANFVADLDEGHDIVTPLLWDVTGPEILDAVAESCGMWTILKLTHPEFMTEEAALHLRFEQLGDAVSFKLRYK